MQPVTFRLMPTYLSISLAAYFFLALSGLIDKVLLQKIMISPRAYAFYVGMLSVLVFVLLPFGVISVPGTRTLLAAATSGFAGVYALWAFYSGLKDFEPTRVITTVGALTPVLTLILSTIIFSEVHPLSHLLAVVLLVLGGILLSLRGTVGGTFSLALLNHAVISAGLFAVSLAMMRFVFLHEPFLNGLFWVRIGGLLGALSIIAVPENFRRIYWATKKAPKTAPVPFLFNQGLGGLGGVLQNYAISLGSASLVTAIQGVQYVFLFFLAIILGRYFTEVREKLSSHEVMDKLVAMTVVGLGLYLLATQ